MRVLCCIGDLVEDVVVWLTSDIAYGTDTAVRITRRQGGSAANVAVAAASLGVAARFVGRVGDDASGGGLIEECRAAGVDPVVQRSGRTGTIVVLVDPSGERSMLADRGAAMQLDSVSEHDLDDVAWLHVPAYSLVAGSIARASLDAIDVVRCNGGSVSIDASSVAIIEDFGVARFAEMIEELDPEVVLCNRDEAGVLGVAERRGIAGAAVTVVKMGADGAVAFAGGQKVAAAPAVDLPVVRDTTGAGDAFAAGYIAAVMEGRSVGEALAMGNRVAAGVLREFSP